MVKFYRVLSQIMTSLVLASCLSALAAPESRQKAYQLDHQTLALGEPLTLSITRALDSSTTPLAKLDLSPLLRDFEIRTRTLGRDSHQENLALTLYPRRLGRVELPSLGLRGKGPVVTVTATSDKVPRVLFRVSTDPAEPRVRQAMMLTLEACDDGSLLWKRPQLPATEGLMLRPINETEIITQRDGQRCTAHRWHWAVLPTAAGYNNVLLPMLEASKFGTLLRFEPPSFEFQAKPLPPWLPTEVAIGAPEIVAEPLPMQAVIDRPVAWRLRVTGSYSLAALQTLLALQLRQVGAPLDMTSYAPRIEVQDSTSAAPQHLVTLYLLPRTRGAGVLPDLLLPWYEPQSGRLMQAHIPGPRLEVIAPIRQRILVGGVIVTGLVTTALIGVWLWRWHRWRLRRRQTRHALRQAASTADLNHLLLRFSATPGAPAAATLRNWQRLVEAQFSSRGLEELVTALERQRFAQPAATQDAADSPAPARLMERIEQAEQWLASLRPRRPNRPPVSEIG